MNPFQIFSNAVRANEIVATLVRHGFSTLLEEIKVPRSWFMQKVLPKPDGNTTWQHIRMACEDLGPVFVKIGQLLSSRPDMIPAPLVVELKKLRNKARPVSYAKIAEVLRSEVDGEVEDHFINVEHDAVASGSLAQVHRAWLKEHNERVALKIQRPGIEKAIDADFEILAWFAGKIHDNIEYLKPYNLPAIVDEVKVALHRELDFTQEAHNATLFNVLNPYPEKVFAPTVFDEYTSRRLIVTQWVNGVLPDEVEVTPEEGQRLARNGGESVFHQIILAGFFHGDPHGGNLLVTPDKRICFVDWGVAGLLTRAMRYFLADLLSAVATQDPEKVVQVAMRQATSSRRVDQLQMEKQVTYVLRKYLGGKVGGEDIGKLMMELLHVFGTCGIDVVRDYTLLAKVVLSIEETGRTFDPDFDFRPLAKNCIDRLVRERYNPFNILEQSRWYLFGLMQKLQELPADIQRLVRRLEEEDINIQLEHTGLGELERTLDTGVNRLVFAIVIASLIIGSSIVITTGVEPHLWGYPVIGLLGYSISAILGLWIIIDILRHGKHR